MKPTVIKFRVFGSTSCKDCVKLKSALSLYAVDFQFINTDDAENDELCDSVGVEDIPHIQALREETGEVIMQRIGYVSPLTLLRDLAARLEEMSEPRDMDLKGVRGHSSFSIQPTKKITKSCNGCNNGSQDHRSQ